MTATSDFKVCRRSGGPRTPHGKSKSSLNSQKHLIFINRVLPEEEIAASFLYDQIQAEFNLQGTLELSIGQALVLNQLQASRIEEFAVQEVIKARRLPGLDVNDPKYSPRYPIPKEQQSEPDFCTRFRPAFCVRFLRHLKRLIEERGFQPDEDMKYVSSIYGSQPTVFAQLILSYYQVLKMSESFEKTDEKAKEQKKKDRQARIIETIELEIEAQGVAQSVEGFRELCEAASGPVLLPPPDVDARIEHYRTAKIRATARLLGILETIRHLKHGREARTNAPEEV